MRRALIYFAAVAAAVSTLAAYQFQVYGEIGKKYQRLGGPAGWLGQPLNDETGTPDGVGRYNHFQHGSIYWTPATGAREIHGYIRDKWASMGWERSLLRYPISDERQMDDPRGRFSNFQGGTLFWSARTGAHFLHGAIMPKWISLQGSRGFLGFPVSDETVAPDGTGHFAHFEGGSIYWSASTGAHEVHGFIRDKWAALGWERGRLGYPVSDEFQAGALRRSNFQHGCLQWTAQTGASLGCGGFGNDVVLNPARE